LFRLICLISVACSIEAASLSFTDKSWTPVHGQAVSDPLVMHEGARSIRLEATSKDPDARVHSIPINLGIGKRYELTGWVRTEDLSVRDLARSPIASGAALTMASMPFDVHSASVAGTKPWTRLSLRFIATRAQDQIVLTAGNGGALDGKAWFAGVSLDEISSADQWPASEAVQTFGPAYRYPAAGWIYLHIEGKPYERGFQHGYLMAHEIPEYLTRANWDLAGRSDQRSWNEFRTTANALFLRGFDREILEEMRGIADGANANGAKFLNRKLDLIDIVVANTEVEMSELRAAVKTTPTGIDGERFEAPPYANRSRQDSADHCSAFAATGPATRDGKMIIGHVTWWSDALAEQTNVMLDIKPESGHHILMQSYPAGIESGTDWYQNDAGMVLTETTLEQTPFNAQGTPVAFRARLAIQYGGNIDEIVKLLDDHNNGLYTNEWLIGDAKDNEIAMYELGTNHTKLWRSSKNEWFGSTPGFYWGDNNAKDINVNLEYLPDPAGAPRFAPYVPALRDLAWQDLYNQYKGQIDEQFAYQAFDRAPLVSAATMDAKITTADMANQMMVWAEFGRPNESVKAARTGERGPNRGLFPGGYYVFEAAPSESLQASIAAREKERLARKKPDEERKKPAAAIAEDRLWKGWLLPASDADNWFVAGSAAYYRTIQSKELDKNIDNERVRLRGLKLSANTPLNRFRIQQAEGVLFLDGLRRNIGDEAFLKLMKDYFEANTTKTVNAQSFLDKAGVTYAPPDPGAGPAWSVGQFGRRELPGVIVYGTVREAGVNRYTAEQLQSRLREQTQREFPIYKDYEAPAPVLASSDVAFIGRPETNSALAEWSSEIGLDYQGGVYRVEGKPWASERDALVFAARNPKSAPDMVLVFAGNSPLATFESLPAGGNAPFVVLEDGKPAGPSKPPAPTPGETP
jgi:Phospholipase B